MPNSGYGMAVVAWLMESLLILLLLSKLSPPELASPPSGVVVLVLSSMILPLTLISPSMAVVVSKPPPMVLVDPMLLPLGPLSPPMVVLMLGAGGIGELAMSMVFPLGLISPSAAAIVSTMFGAGGMGEVAVRATVGPVDRGRASGGSGGFLFEGLRPPLPRLGILPDYLVNAVTGSRCSYSSRSVRIGLAPGVRSRDGTSERWTLSFIRAVGEEEKFGHVTS